MSKKNKFLLKINYENCKGCEYCIITCPQKVLSLSDEVNKLGYRFVKIINQQNCNGCGRCYIMCPDYLIEIFSATD
ncbi:MAG: 4Fe-4S binding protein [Endomicrobia bacterium]|nr:4Fe-4S binding protein [Endomicrobiia bacterium]MCX7940438.1 4Fe-4S binding protein [Endomicrobiia bacterium]MDW8055869.1 4Fe-4S binding protein [Elusimicrobiota bacterium]